MQLSLETGAQTGCFAGRVEHLNSGRRARFVSPDELIDALKRMLAEIEKPTP